MNNRLVKYFIVGILFYVTHIVDTCAQSAYSLDVNGIKIGASMTKAQMIYKFGEPDGYVLLDDGSLIGIIERYNFNGNSLTFMDGKLVGFSIVNDDWSVLSDYFENGLKVGSPVSLINQQNRFSLLKHPRFNNVYYILDNPLPELPPDFYLQIELKGERISKVYYSEQN